MAATEAMETRDSPSTDAAADNTESAESPQSESETARSVADTAADCVEDVGQAGPGIPAAPAHLPPATPGTSVNSSTGTHFVSSEVDERVCICINHLMNAKLL